MPRANKQFNLLPISLQDDDVCTIVSIVPFLISEFKPGIYPGRFVIQPCLDYNKPEILEVGTSVYFIPQFNGDEEMPAHVVKTSCKEIATAVIKDYLSAQMDVNEDCKPGLTFVSGRINPLEFSTKNAVAFLKLKRDQSSWFSKLVQRADNDWNKYKHHKVISENQRFACRALNLEREWLTPVYTEVATKCPACLQNCLPNAIVCANCRCILKSEEYKKLSFAA